MKIRKIVGFIGFIVCVLLTQNVSSQVVSENTAKIGKDIKPD